jgi:CheY-like chemotaxis protein
LKEPAILCVDDEALVLHSLKEQLQRRFGRACQIETALSAEDAWVVIEELGSEGIEIVVIVSDWLMPGVRGDEFLAQVHRRFPAVVTVLLTGQADAAAIERARREAGLHACLHKPWRDSELAQAIESALAPREAVCANAGGAGAA